MRRFVAALALLFGLAGGAYAQGTLRVYGDYPNATVTGTLTETLLATVTIPANALGPNGAFRLTYTATETNSANNKTLNFLYNATGPGITGQLINAVTQTTNISQQGIVYLRAANTTGTQAAYPNSQLPYATTANAINFPTLDTTQTTYLNITGTLANVADSLTLTGWTLEIIRP